MTVEKFKDYNFKPATLTIIEQANTIIREYQRQGFKLTLRQLYYQFVSRNLLANKQSEYKRLGGIIDNGRQAGLIDWAAIEDRTRNLEKLSMWSSPADILAAVAQQYREDPWLKQDIYPEVWIEKDALTGVIEGVCEEFRVPYFACRGYASQSEMYDAAKRLQAKARKGFEPVIFHLGDHDPSGIDMTRDNQDRLSLFSGLGIRVVRLALNMEQIEEYDPPPNPLKENSDGTLSDSRGLTYQDEFGDSSWELDALSPAVIDQLIRDALNAEISVFQWDKSKRLEEEAKVDLAKVAESWPDVRRYLAGRDFEVLNIGIEGFQDVDDILREIEDQSKT